MFSMKSKILLVDDNSEFVDSTKDVLEMEGYEVLTTASGEDAVRITKSNDFDIILMDIKMPGMNGVDAFIEMKKHNPGVRVVMVTAYSIQDLIRKALDEGACAVLDKPLDMGRLITTIESARRRGGVILVADDDLDFCDNLYDNLTEVGYSVFTACDGKEALNKALERSYDILLLDMKLPVLNGLELYRRIKPLQPRIITIVISGYMQEMHDFIQQALEENALTALEKPLDMSSLLQLLNEVCAPENTI
jgi:DNA-binding NtrC family response regulator